MRKPVYIVYNTKQHIFLMCFIRCRIKVGFCHSTAYRFFFFFFSCCCEYKCRMCSRVPGVSQCWAINSEIWTLKRHFVGKRSALLWIEARKNAKLKIYLRQNYISHDEFEWMYLWREHLWMHERAIYVSFHTHLYNCAFGCEFWICSPFYSSRSFVCTPQYSIYFIEKL